MGEEIVIYEIPRDVNTEGITMVAKGCINTSYEVARINPEVEVIEGLVIIFDNEERATAVAHMWNRLHGKDFDITYEKVWKDTEEMKETKELKYYQTQIKVLTSFTVGELNDFSADTKLQVEEINRIILRKSKK